MRLSVAPWVLVAASGLVGLVLFMLAIAATRLPQAPDSSLGPTAAASHSASASASAAAACPTTPATATAMTTTATAPTGPTLDPLQRCVPLRVGNGGVGLIPNGQIEQVRIDKDQRFYGVYDDLLHFTGLDERELRRRLGRVDQFHFEGEHAWWGPSTATELAWYYRTSASYLFANAIHPDVTGELNLTVADGPVLDYSGGVGNNVIALAQRGIQVVYFGIGLQEFEFAHYRVEAKGLQHLVQFVRPFSRNSSTGVLEFNPRTSVPDLQFGAILAFDVLEHIPDYHITLAHLISVLRPGGRIFESTPFGNEDDPVAVHQKASMPMAQAMVGMTRQTMPVSCKVWVKQ